MAQIYNSNPERMQKAAALVQNLGFDGVDINMGCPVNAVVRQISGAALIKYPDLAIRIIDAAKRGAPDIPISVKTRIGYASKSEMHNWISILLKTRIDALTVHLRTRNQFSKVPADWSVMPEIIKLRDEISPNTIIVGNGDVHSVGHGIKLTKEYGCDGIMVGRAAFGKPDFFCHYGVNLDPHWKIKTLLHHLDLFDKLLFKKRYKSFHVMKKHFKAYIAGWKGAKELRARLMDTENPNEAMRILESVI